MPTGTLTTDCHLTAGVNIRVKHRCSKLSVYGDRILGEKCGKKTRKSLSGKFFSSTLTDNVSQDIDVIFSTLPTIATAIEKTLEPTFSRLTWISNIFYDTMENQAIAVTNSATNQLLSYSSVISDNAKINFCIIYTGDRDL